MINYISNIQSLGIEKKYGINDKRASGDGFYIQLKKQKQEQSFNQNNGFLFNQEEKENRNNYSMNLFYNNFRATQELRNSEILNTYNSLTALDLYAA